VTQSKIELQQAARNVVSLLRTAAKETEEDRRFVVLGVSRERLLQEKQSFVRWISLWVFRNLAHESWKVLGVELWDEVEKLIEPTDEQRKSWSRAEEYFGTTMELTARSDRPDHLPFNLGKTFAELCQQPTNPKLGQYGEQMFEVTLGLTQHFMSHFELIPTQPL